MEPLEDNVGNRVHQRTVSSTPNTPRSKKGEPQKTEYNGIMDTIKPRGSHDSRSQPHILIPIAGEIFISATPFCFTLDHISSSTNSMR